MKYNSTTASAKISQLRPYEGETWQFEKTRQRRTTKMVLADVDRAIAAITPAIMELGAQSTIETDPATRTIIINFRFSAEQMEEHLDGEEVVDEVTATYFNEHAVPAIAAYIHELWIAQVAEDLHLRKRWKPRLYFTNLTVEEIAEAIGYYE